MKFKITTHCCWFRDGSMIVKMYFINGMPFTFDELPDGHLRDQDLIKEADKHRTYTDEDMYQYYSYLVEEELHPCLFPVDICLLYTSPSPRDGRISRMPSSA